MHLAQTRIEQTPDGRTLIHVTLEVPHCDEMPTPLELESGLQCTLNTIGSCYMTEALTRYDTQGEVIQVGHCTYTSKGKSLQHYETLFGPVSIERHIYQTSNGGTTYCPLEERARIVENATIGLCQVLASKYANLSTRTVADDLQKSNHLDLHVSRIQDITHELSRRAMGKEDRWQYKTAVPSSEAAAIVVYMDATCVAIVDERYKQATVGAIDILNRESERVETIYLANAPEDGKATFFERMDRELASVKKRYPDLRCVGLCDGATDLQNWLEERCDFITLDFYHLSEYVTKVAPAFCKNKADQEAWVDGTMHKLKHRLDGAQLLRSELRKKEADETITKSAKAAVQSALGYLDRNMDRVKYKENRNMGLPIGSGVIEAACKHVIKARVAGSGMRWKRKGLQGVLTLRSLQESTGRWSQFWRKVEVFGW
jgi:hypothetical protein